MLILLAVMPASAHATEHWVGRDLVPRAPTCGSPSDATPAAAKTPLLADNTAGQLIVGGGVLEPDISLSRQGTGKDPAVAAGAQPPCQASSPPLQAGAASFVTTATLSRLAAAAPRMPLIAARLSSGFGLRMHPLLAEVRMHSGVDLAAPLGAPVFATDSGKISSAGWQGGYGIAAVIEHPNGLQTRYGHMSKLNVVAGQQVVKGQIIGFVGSTGLSTGPHLHYEVRFRGQAINPLAMMAPLSVAPKQRKSR